MLIDNLCHHIYNKVIINFNFKCEFKAVEFLQVSQWPAVWPQ